VANQSVKSLFSLINHNTKDITPLSTKEDDQEGSNRATGNSLCGFPRSLRLYFPHAVRPLHTLSPSASQICFVVTSAPYLKDMATGLWLEELAAPYYVFQDAGYDITFTSPAGGPIP
jgi:hypothetical protein